MHQHPQRRQRGPRRQPAHGQPAGIKGGKKASFCHGCALVHGLEGLDRRAEAWAGEGHEDCEGRGERGVAWTPQPTRCCRTRGRTRRPPCAARRGRGPPLPAARRQQHGEEAELTGAWAGVRGPRVHGKLRRRVGRCGCSLSMWRPPLQGVQCAGRCGWASPLPLHGCGRRRTPGGHVARFRRSRHEV